MNSLFDATQECLDRGLLKMANNDSTKFRDVGSYGAQAITVSLQLPSNVVCRHCVFQWKYTAGNKWGTDPVTGEQGLRLGIEHETFMGCADITIVGNRVRSLSHDRFFNRFHFGRRFLTNKKIKPSNIFLGARRL
jgi:hypothetical protein